MARSRNWKLIHNVRLNMKKNILFWIEKNGRNAGDHASPWSVVDTNDLKELLEELVPEEAK